MAKYMAKPQRITPASPRAAFGSVVMVHGLDGTAYQRLYKDGLWHSVVPNVKPLTWEQLCERRNVFLIIDGSN